MKAVLDDSRPIFQQIYEMIEDDIIEGELAEGDKIPSTTEISKFYQVKRATAQKGIGILVIEEVEPLCEKLPLSITIR